MSKCFGFTSLTGGGAGALDAIDGSVITVGDIAIGADTTDGYVYKCDGSGDVESSPDCITPDANAGSKRWKRRHDEQKAYRAASPTNGHMASVDGDGDVVDSGKVSADVVQTTVSTNLTSGNLVKASGNKTIETISRLATDVDEYVDRGDPAAADFTLASFTTDGTWRDLDISSIVPAGTKAVIVRLTLADDAAASLFAVRKNGNSNTVNIFRTATQVSGVPVHSQGIIPVDANRVIEYNGSNLTFTTIDLSILGWFL